MTAYYGDNYTGAYRTVPQAQMPKGEQAGKVCVLKDKITLTAALTAVAPDTIDCGFIPVGATILGAKMFCNKSLGATGIFDLGLRAFTDMDGNTVSEDADSLVKSLDLGGQAALASESLTSLALFKKVGQSSTYPNGAQVFVTCTELMDGTVIDGVLHIEVEYSI